jgi:hypothetical protein
LLEANCWLAYRVFGGAIAGWRGRCPLFRQDEFSAPCDLEPVFLAIMLDNQQTLITE